MPTPKILLIYTGGTIGMVSDPATGALKPLNFNEIEKEIPALRALGVEIEHYEDLTPIDSSDVTPANWVELARVIEKNYAAFDGFVVLHGTDTMAWTASALSFMLEGLAKPVVFTGSQIPIGVMRTDGRENLVTAVEIAAAFSQESADAGGKLDDETIRRLDNETIRQLDAQLTQHPANAAQTDAREGLQPAASRGGWLTGSESPKNTDAGGGRNEPRECQPYALGGGGLKASAKPEKSAASAAPQLMTHHSSLMTPMVPEVSIYFQNRLFRANRTTKWSAEQLDAFTSENYPPLAEVGVTINYHREAIGAAQDDAERRGHAVLRPVRNGCEVQAETHQPESLRISTDLCTDVALVRLFPGMSQKVLEAALGIDGLRGVVLQTFGAGNTPTAPWFLDAIKRAVERGIVILNVTQCIEGSVSPLYESGLRLSRLGVVSGRDMTTEAAMTKLMYLLGRFQQPSDVVRELNLSLRGEMTVL